jgi:hypothetical protein
VRFERALRLVEIAHPGDVGALLEGDALVDAQIEPPSDQRSGIGVEDFAVLVPDLDPHQGPPAHELTHRFVQRCDSEHVPDVMPGTSDGLIA